MAWTLADIRAKVRTPLIGRPSITQISDAEVNALINDFYTRDFARDVLQDSIKAVFTQDLTCVDPGAYAISNAYLSFKKPAFIDDRQIHLTFDTEWFFKQYPNDESCLENPGIGIGSVSVASVHVGDFAYRIEGYSYYTAGVEGLLTGSNLPTGKFGAWLVEIATSGALVITQAGANATGYASERLAMEGLPNPDAARACCGFVVIQNASGAVFVPGTTLLSAGGLTVSYVDGKPTNRNEPCMALIWGGILTVRPKSNDRHRFQCECLQKPTALSGDSDTPLNEDWGLAIAYGTAIKFLAETDSGETGALLPGLYDREIENLQLDYYRNLQQREVSRSF
jgi:hypothetical protein